jgi:hypothetical protein
METEETQQMVTSLKEMGFSETQAQMGAQNSNRFEQNKMVSSCV